jgi:hypothetical protein
MRAHGSARADRRAAAPARQGPRRAARGRGHVFGLIGTALSKNIIVFQTSSLKVAPISPNAL